MNKIILTKSKLTSSQRKELGRIVKEESDLAIKRCQYIMMLAIMDEFGIGKKRLDRWLNRYMQYLDDFKVFVMDDAGDEILLSRMRQRGYDIYKL